MSGTDSPSKTGDVTTFKDVSVVIDGKGGKWFPPVASITLHLKSGAIPVAYVAVDPAHDLAAYPEGPDDAEVVTMAAIREWHDKAQAYAADPTTKCSLSATASSENNEQQLKLEDWILLSAGFTGVSTSGSMALELQMQHPAGKLDRCTANIGSITGMSDDTTWPYSTFVNPVVGLAEAVKFMLGFYTNSKAHEGATEAEQTTVYDKAKAEIAKQAELLTTALVWTKEWPDNSPGYSDLPFSQTHLAEPAQKEGVQSAFRTYAESVPSASLWSTFIDSVCTDFDVTVIPTYWNPGLEVVPFTPYGNPAMTIYDDEIYNAGLPAVDPAPIGGVRVVLAPGGGEGAGLSFFDFNVGNPAYGASRDILYLAKVDSGVPGKVVTVGAPSWLWQARQFEADTGDGLPDLNGAGDAISPDDSDPNYMAGSSSSGGGGAKVAAPVDTYTNAAYGYGHAMFLAMYHDNSQVSINTPLMITSKSSQWPGGYVIPGCVARIKLREFGETFMDAYITEVVHTIDVAGAEAHSQILGSYCRADGSLVPSGTFNPIYANE